MPTLTKYPYDKNLATGYEDDGSFSSSDSQKLSFSYFHQKSIKPYEIRVNALSKKSVERYQYDPYGKRKVMNAGYGEMVESSIGQEFGYTGRQHDSEDTGLMYFRARMYSCDLGRFLCGVPNYYRKVYHTIRRTIFDHFPLFNHIGVVATFFRPNYYDQTKKTKRDN